MSKDESVIRTFRVKKDLMNGLERFLSQHPEVTSLNHLVTVALEEFLVIHKGEKTWVKS